LDPVSQIVGALIAGATSGFSDVAAGATRSAYASLIALARRRLGRSERGQRALAGLAADPDRWGNILAGELAAAGASQDAALIFAAGELLTLAGVTIDARGAQVGNANVRDIRGDVRIDQSTTIIHSPSAPAGPERSGPGGSPRGSAAKGAGGIVVILGIVFGLIALFGHGGPAEAGGMATRWTANVTTGLSRPVAGLVYGGDSSGKLYAMDAATGAVRWTHNFYYPIDATPAVGGGKVYVTSNGKLWAVEDRKGHLAWSVSVTEASDLGITAAYGMVYLNGSDPATGMSRVYAFSQSGGKLRWRSSDLGITASRTAPVVAAGTVYNVSDYGVLSALDAVTGTTRWTFTPPGQALTPGQSAPAVSRGTVYFMTGYQNSARLLAISASSGTVAWSYHTAYLDDFTPAATAHRVYVTSAYGTQGTVHALDSGTGRQVWARSISSPYAASPVAARDLLYLDDGRGYLYGLNITNGCLAWSDTQGMGMGVTRLVIWGADAYLGDASGVAAYHLTPPATTPPCHPRTRT
jgi:outer membrane protein assembly factor BamB